VALGVLLLAPAIPAWAQSPSDVAERIHREGGYDSELPIAEGLGSGATTAPAEPRDLRSRRHGDEGGGSGLLAYLILGVVLAGLVALFLTVLVRWRPEVGSDEDVETTPNRPRHPVAPAAPAIALVEGDPDALAAEGRFEEALAALLLRALKAVGWEPTGQARGSTAREVLASLPADDPGRLPLAGVVTRQERVAFGGETASRERYEEARRLLASLTARSDDDARQ